jgi:hypothetical protein
MASSVSVANKNKADIWDGNEYKIPKNKIFIYLFIHIVADWTSS